MRILRCAILATTILSSPAFAGEEVLYAPASEWVIESDLANAGKGTGPSDLLWDWQYRLEDGVVLAFTDQATRIDNPQKQMEMNQISLAWLPDKGDLTVNRLEIIRDGEVIDLIAQGVTFEVLRRETGLEERLLDGELTATLSVPGLRVGDVLRIAHTVSTDDQALGDEVQALQFLYSEPWQVGNARAIMSWPADEEMYWRVEDRVTVAEPVLRDGYNYLTVEMPLAEAEPVPSDAPFRYQRPPVLRVGSFADWSELSAIMAPHYQTAANLADGSDVAAQAQTIMQASDDPLVRAAMAVELVQEEVSYLLDGLDGGNYLPQAAETTWDVRYGDCKAKTVLLLALLHEMGIEAEAVLVTTQGGDAVPELLPLPAAFNHVIVHAVIGSTDYWLDGTMNGTRLATLGDVPNFYYALPIRAGGADLMPITPRDPAVPQMAVTMTVDHRAGVDLPTLFEMQIRVVGPAGTSLRAMVDEDNPATLRQLAQRFSSDDQDVIVSDFSIAYDEEEAIAKVDIRGISSTAFEWRDGRLRAETAQFDGSANFNPDRARRAWREIPVATQGPLRQRTEFVTILPDGGAGFRLEGEESFTGGYGNMRVASTSQIEEGALHVVQEVFMLPGEIAAADIADAKRAARRMDNVSLDLLPPQDITWRWELGEQERDRRAQPILAAYDAAIDFADTDDFGPLQARALFAASIYDFAEAQESFDQLIDQSPSAWAHMQRASIHEALGNNDDAIADLEAAWDLEPFNSVALELVRLLSYADRIGEAQEILDLLPVGEEDRTSYTGSLATVFGLDGDVDGGLSLISDRIAESPQNPDILNSDCWYRGLFGVALEDALDRCTQAVERAQYPAAALDSRALVRFRQGNLAEALSDLDAALELSPGLAPSLYLRGIVRLSSGDNGGNEDIASALRMMPQLPQTYSRHGIVPPS